MNLLKYSSRFGCFIAVLFCSGLSLSQDIHSGSQVTTLGLPRIADQPVAKYSGDTLAVEDTAGVQCRNKHGSMFLALIPRHEWSRPLRGKAPDLVFVSFCVYGSVGSIIEAGGARFGIIDSEVDGYAQLAVDENSKWRLLGIHVPLQKFDGNLLGAFQVLTVRLDRADGYWDLYHNAKLVAEDLPIDASIKHGQFVVKAGEEGAMINGLVQCDVNPLYADDNSNGVDDAFEQQKRGRLLSATDSKADRKQLIADWRKHQRTSPPPALFVNLPQPD